MMCWVLYDFVNSTLQRFLARLVRISISMLNENIVATRFIRSPLTTAVNSFPSKKTNLKAEY